MADSIVEAEYKCREDSQSPLKFQSMSLPRGSKGSPSIVIVAVIVALPAGNFAFS